MRQTELRNKRLEHRIPGTNGRWFNPMAPKHGIPTGMTRWGCSCEPCLEATRRRYHADRARRLHNLELIKQLFAKEIAPDPVEPVVVEAPPPETQPEPQPEPIRMVVTEPVEAPPLDWPVPQMLRAVRERITTLETLGLVVAAYHEPHWRLVMDGGREKRAYKSIEIVVADEHGPILAVYDRKTEPDEVVQKETTNGVRRAKGGRGGSKAPTTLKELKSRLPSLRCSWETTRNGHVRVVTPGNQSVIMPSTASDWRSIRNSWAQLQRVLREETT